MKDEMINELKRLQNIEMDFNIFKEKTNFLMARLELILKDKYARTASFKYFEGTVGEYLETCLKEFRGANK